MKYKSLIFPGFITLKSHFFDILFGLYALLVPERFSLCFFCQSYFLNYSEGISFTV